MASKDSMFDGSTHPAALALDAVRPNEVTTSLLDPSTSADALDEGARRLRNGELVAFATETVYGLGASISRTDAVARIFTAKGRPTTDPLIVHIADADEVDAVAAIPRRLRELVDLLAERFWPGPLTLVLPRHHRVTDLVSGGRDTVAVRVPGHADARTIIARTGAPVAAPSANRFGHISPTTASAVLADLGGRVDAIIDSGPCRFGIESTVLDLSRTDSVPEVLRPGAVTTEELRGVCPDTNFSDSTLFAADADAPRAPGRRVRHYAPRATAVLVAPALVDAAEAACNNLGRRVHRLAGGDPASLAPRFYASLRELDRVASGVSSDDRSDLVDHDRPGAASHAGSGEAGSATILLIEPDSIGGIGTALLDRMWRAAEGRWVRAPSDIARIADWLEDFR